MKTVVACIIIGVNILGVIFGLIDGYYHMSRHDFNYQTMRIEHCGGPWFNKRIYYVIPTYQISCVAGDWMSQ